MVVVGFVFWLGSITMIDEPLPFTIGLLTGGSTSAPSRTCCWRSRRAAWSRATRRLVVAAYIDVLTFASVSVTADRRRRWTSPATSHATCSRSPTTSRSARRCTSSSRRSRSALSLWLIVASCSNRMRVATPAQRRALAPMLLVGHDLRRRARAGAGDGHGRPARRQRRAAEHRRHLSSSPRCRSRSCSGSCARATPRRRRRRARRAAQRGRPPAIAARRARRRARRRRLQLRLLVRATGALRRRERHRRRPADARSPAARSPRSSATAGADRRDRPRRRAAATSRASCGPPAPPRRLPLENERLEAELRARVAGAAASRARRSSRSAWPSAGALERNLHDGAQQRLVALVAAARRWPAQAARRPRPAPRRSSTARARSWPRAGGAARAGARHPSGDPDRPRARRRRSRRWPAGAGAGEIDELPDDPAADRRWRPSRTSSSRESLTNVAKYARSAEYASVRVVASNGYAVVEVRTTASAAPTPTAGSGLRGLADRLAAARRPAARSTPRPASGTTIRARIPCA